MPQVSLSQQSFFDPEFVSPSILEPGTLPWLLARYKSYLFAPWLLKGWRGEGKVGRNAWPAHVLACLWVLRWSEEGTSRLASVKRARTDLEWRAVLGLRCDVDPPSERTMRDFEKFLARRHPETGVPRFTLLHEHFVRLCKTHGVIGEDAIWATDSTPMWCYGAVLDTVRLLGDGLRQLGRRWARANRTSLSAVATDWELPLLLAKSTKGHFTVDWRDSDERAAVVTTLAGDVVRIVARVREELAQARPAFRKGLMKRCRDLLAVVSNDLEADDQGRLVIARRVARDRLISITDPQARHGRKSDKQLFNGFKLHVLGDLESGVIASLTVTAGNLHDGAPSHRLVRRAKALLPEIEKVLADTAYGGAHVRQEVQRTLGVELLTPPPPNTHRNDGRLAKADFTIDFVAKTATCPAGVTTDQHDLTPASKHGRPAMRFRWDRKTCQACPLRTACLAGQARSRRLVLHPFEEELRDHRSAWQDPEVRQRYRRRAEFERLIHTAVQHGARQARAWGLAAANLQAHAIVASCNLALLAKALFARERPAETKARAA
jgi:hypothetical protein